MPLPSGTPLNSLDQQQIRELQNVLLRAGFNPGPIDGVLGDQTRAAYTRFLRANSYDPQANTQILSIIDLLAQQDPEAWQMVKNGGEQGTSAQATTGVSLGAAPTGGTPSTSAPTTTVNTSASTNNPPPVASDGSTEEAVRRQYPHLAYLLDNPEVKAVLLDAASKGWDDATLQGALWKTTWWQTTSNVTRLWDQKFNQDNATALAEWDQKTAVIGNRAAQMGFQLNDQDTKWIAGRVLREGWSDEQLNRFLGTLARQNGIGPGQVTEQAAMFKQLAKNYMTNLTDKQAMEYAIRVSEGTLSREGVESLLRNEAKGRFYWLAPQIDAGFSPMDLFGSMRKTVADTLEMDAEQIDMSDPQWSALTSPIIGEDGKVRSMNFHEAQRWARQRPEWRFTDNANRSAAETELFVLKAMGLVS